MFIKVLIFSVLYINIFTIAIKTPILKEIRINSNESLICCDVYNKDNITPEVVIYNNETYNTSNNYIITLRGDYIEICLNITRQSISLIYKCKVKLNNSQNFTFLSNDLLFRSYYSIEEDKNIFISTKNLYLISVLSVIIGCALIITIIVIYFINIRIPLPNNPSTIYHRGRRHKYSTISL